MSKLRYRFALTYILATSILIGWSFLSYADEFHKPPYNFFFGNHLDTHQETRLKKKRNQPVSLTGFFYIVLTGEIDPDSELPIAEHPSDNQCVDEADSVDCVVGWVVAGLPGHAKFLYHTGVNGEDHPVWMVNRVDIPQPGSFTHFHWITNTSSDPRAGTVPAACNKINAGQLEDSVPTATDVVCPGWFLEIEAVAEFAFRHGNEVVPVYPGLDNTTHLNLVTNYQAELEITPSRP